MKLNLLHIFVRKLHLLKTVLAFKWMHNYKLPARGFKWLKPHFWRLKF